MGLNGDVNQNMDKQKPCSALFQGTPFLQTPSWSIQTACSWKLV